VGRPTGVIHNVNAIFFRTYTSGDWFRRNSMHEQWDLIFYVSIHISNEACAEIMRKIAGIYYIGCSNVYFGVVK
jgi:hypothetical protein